MAQPEPTSISTDVSEHFSLNTPGPKWPPECTAVSRLFREAWPNRKRYPDLLGCSYVCTTIQTVRLKGVKAPKSPPLLGEGEKHARRLLKHLPATRASLQVLDFRQVPLDPEALERADGEASPIDALPEAFREIMELVDKMTSVERDLRTLLNARFPFPDRRNAARFIGDAAREAWRRAGETPPGWTSTPLRVFVT